MKFNWKVAVGLALPVNAVLAGWLYLYMTNQKAADTNAEFYLPDFNLELNCTDSASKVDTIVCSDKALTALDKELTVAYANDSLWRFTQASAGNYDDVCKKSNIRTCLRDLEKRQQRWVTRKHDRCDTVKCLTKAYRARISELNGQSEPLASFRLGVSIEPAVCDAMLEILNRTPREQLGACAHYDFSNTPFTPVTTRLTAEHWQEFERFYHKKTSKQEPYPQYWTSMEQRYQTGLRRLYGVQYQDVNKDKVAWLQEVSFPSQRCQTQPYGSYDERHLARAERDNQFNTLDATGELQHAEKYGWMSVIAAPAAGYNGVLHKGQLLRFNDEWYVLNQEGMELMHSPERYVSKYLVKLLKLNLDEGSYSISGRKLTCGYWYNY
ncbi:lysozyme inhibitor LprI family protein [Rheinheimera sp.]|uniref:lysozyme inhibitor LprI family protein n=1 Tax=Rheinheimera sp. TaxID=1869214 RepID=UPI002732D5A8|nr:lysozyme inhibitor LprI family protein [Rheinheimera sp.]MDP2713837.1 lysozyme inhibitor LprI family protein [Rheinheimera sp.]